MANTEFWFAFVLVPIYLGLAYALSHSVWMRNAKLPSTFAVNWVFAALLLGSFSMLTGFAGGNGISVALFSGTLAAIIATGMAGKLSLKAAPTK